MTAVNAQLVGTGVGSSRRSANRRKLHLPVQGITTLGASDVIILDISTTGVLLRTAADLTNGETIQLNFPEAIAASALVKWSDGRTYGCKFLDPISNVAVSKALLRAPHKAGVSPEGVASAMTAPTNATAAGWVIGLSLLSWSLVIAAAATLAWP